MDPSDGARRRQAPQHVERLSILVYRAREGRLVRADIPFWFYNLKGTAAQFLLRDTGFDLESLGIAPGDLQQRGPGIVLDEARDNGDHVRVWTEG